MVNSEIKESSNGFWSAEPKTLGFKAWLVLMLYGGTLLGLWLGSTRALSGHEALRCEPAREMIMTGNWVIPHFGQMPAIQKPAMVNWFIATSMLVFNSEAEWVCRFPSVLVTLLTGWMVAAMGARWHGRRTGLTAGLIFVSSFYVMMQARLAEIDMILCMAVTAAIFCFMLAEEDTKWSKLQYHLLVAGFFGSVAIAFLAKLLIGPCMIAGGIIIYVLINRRWKSLLFCLNPLGWIVFFVIALPWFIAAYNMYPPILDRWFNENVGRFTRSHGTWGKGSPLLLYFYETPMILLPWTLWLIPAIITGIREKKWLQNNWQLIACFFFSALAILTASSWKHKHYIIPVLPGLAIPTAWYLIRNTYDRIDKRHPVFVTPLIILSASAVGIYIAWTKLTPEIALPMTIGIVILFAMLSIASTLDYYAKPHRTLLVLFASFWFVGVYFQGFMMQHFDDYKYEASLGRRINQQVAQDEPIHALKIGESQVVYYLRWPIVRSNSVETFLENIAADPQNSYHVVIKAKDLELAKTLGNVEILDEALKPRQNQPPENKLVFIQLCPNG